VQDRLIAVVTSLAVYALTGLVMRWFGGPGRASRPAQTSALITDMPASAASFEKACRTDDVAQQSYGMLHSEFNTTIFYQTEGSLIAN
jgi:hypothetical protein